MLKEKSEIELVSLYQESGDHQYLTELFTRHSDIVYRTAYHIMKNSSDAEDVMQTAYIEMVQSLLRYKHTGSVVGWMLQVVVHNCYDRIRSEKSRKNRERKIMSERAQTSSPKNYELTEMIESHLSKLPDIYKVPIVLQIIEGLSIKEVAEALEIPEKTIRSQIARGLEKLKVSLQRVGVTASVISVGDILKEIQKPVVPEVFKTNQYFNSLYQAKAATSTKLAITTSSKGITFQSVMAISLLAAVSIGSIFAWLHFSNKSITPIATASKMTQKWDFENTKDVSSYQDIGIKKGGISIAESRGVNGTNGLMVEEKTLIELDISKFKLPIRITYSADFFTSTANSAHVLINANYKKDQKVLTFNRLSENYYIEILKNSPNAKLGFTGKSISHIYYVDETSIYHWLAGGPDALFLGSSVDHKKVLLFIPGKVIIDDLVIESIDRNILPSISEFEKVASTFAYKEGVDEYNIDKEKVGLSKNSRNPVLHVERPETILSGVKNEVIHPYLSESNRVEWVRPRLKNFQKWDFENKQNLSEYQGIGLSSGAIYLAESRGVNDSCALMVNEDTLVVIDISTYQLPLKISYKTDVIITSKSNNFLQRIFRNNYLKGQKLYYLFDLNEKLNIGVSKNNENSKLGYTGNWFSTVVYIDEDSVDGWLNGARCYFFQGKSNDKNKLFISVRGKSIIDDLTIESINKKELPEKKLYERAAELLEYKDGVELYLVDKEKLGLDSNGKFQPKMEVKTVESFEYLITDIKNEVSCPFLSKKNKVEWKKNISQKWDFEDKSQFFDFNLKKGNLVQVGERGVNGSSCMGVEAYSLIEFDISKFKLPIKISYVYDNIVPKSGMTNLGILMVKGNCQKDKNILSFLKFSPAKQIDTTKMGNRNNNTHFGFFGEWFSATIYVSEECVDLWFNGNRTGLVHAKSNDNKKLYLHVLDKSFIDNIVIESVDQESIPDVSKFTSFAATVPFVRSHKEYYKLDNKEKELLGIDKNSDVELGTCDSATIEMALGIQNNFKVTADNIDTEGKK